MLTITSDVGNATQGQRVPDHQVLPIGSAQRVQEMCHSSVLLLLGRGRGEDSGNNNRQQQAKTRTGEYVRAS